MVLLEVGPLEEAVYPPSTLPGSRGMEVGTDALAFVGLGSRNPEGQLSSLGVMEPFLFVF